VETASAQVETAQALYDKARTSGGRALFQRLMRFVPKSNYKTAAAGDCRRNEYAKQKLVLGRIIGLPGGQEITLTDQAPYEP